jgi:hypothetical protein
MRGYEKIKATRQVDLVKYLSTSALRRRIGFATSNMPEDLHYDESYEFLIPQDNPIKVKIFPNSYKVANKGNSSDETLSEFDEVIVVPGEMLVIYPEHCHRVMEKGRFIVLKVEGKWKILAKPDSSVPGCCTNTSCSMWSYCEKLGVKNSLSARGVPCQSKSP